VKISDILPGGRVIEPATLLPNATPVIISPTTRAPRSEIKIYRGNAESVVSSTTQ
jgi:hypothetical protein